MHAAPVRTRAARIGYMENPERPTDAAFATNPTSRRPVRRLACLRMLSVLLINCARQQPYSVAAWSGSSAPVGKGTGLSDSVWLSAAFDLELFSSIIPSNLGRTVWRIIFATAQSDQSKARATIAPV